MTSVRQPTAYLNGEWLPFEELKIPVFDLGLMQGASITERLRTVRQVPYLVAEHLDRLELSLERVGWPCPVARNELHDVIARLARHNGPLIPAAEDLSIVLFITAGQALGDANGVVRISRPTVCAYSAPLPLTKWRPQHREGVHLVTPEIRSLPPNVVDPRIKMRSRLHWLLAEQAAHAIDPASAALLRNAEGFVTETSTGNLFVVRNGELATPRAEDTLPGIAQAQVLRFAEELGYPVTRCDLSVEAVQQGDEAFLTSSTYCMLPVSRVNGAAIGDGRHQDWPVFRELADRWAKEIGLDFVRQCAE